MHDELHEEMGNVSYGKTNFTAIIIKKFKLRRKNMLCLIFLLSFSQFSFTEPSFDINGHKCYNAFDTDPLDTFSYNNEGYNVPQKLDSMLR